jgi:hypothetical protein
MSSAATAEEARQRLRERLDYRYHEVVEESGIAPDVAVERDYHLEKTKTGLSALGFARSQQRAPAIVIPRFSPSGEEIPPQIKPDSPRIVERNGTIREVKYESVFGSQIRLSVHPRSVKVMRDARHALFITEGDKKGDALVSRGAAAVILQGVSCWDVPQDWEDIKLYGRNVIVAFDADVMINPNVQSETLKLATFLRERGAKVRFLRWPERYRGTKMGVDDFLASGDGTAEDLLRMAEDAPDEEAQQVGISMADIEPEVVEWLWRRRVPKAKVTILDGDPGKGKSLILYDLAARITSGQDLPDGQPTEPASVLIVSAEDGAADTIVPRFLAAGGDPKRARIIGSEEPFLIPDDLDKLERAIRQTGASFVVIDPVMSFLSDNINSNRDQDVRRALQPLVDIARRTGAAIVICRHLNKSTGGQSIYRGQGSIGFIGIVRSGLMVGNHPERDEVFVLAGQKHNLSKPPESLAYRITDAGPGDETAVIKYLGISEVTAQQMNTTPEDEGERDRLAEAKEFLRNVLRAGPVPSKQVKREATEADIAWRTVERAKGQLRVQSYRDGPSGRWMWILPGPPEEGDDHRQAHDGGDGGDGGLRNGTKTAKDGGDGGDDLFSNNNNNKKAYIREDRQDRQDRQAENGGVHTNTTNQDRQDRQKCKHGLVGGLDCYFCDPNHPYRQGGAA